MSSNFRPFALKVSVQWPNYFCCLHYKIIHFHSNSPIPFSSLSDESPETRARKRQDSLDIIDELEKEIDGIILDSAADSAVRRSDSTDYQCRFNNLHDYWCRFTDSTK